MIAHGQRDVLIPVSSSEELIERASGDNQTLTVYRSNHTTLLGTRRYQVYRDIENWLDQQEGQTERATEPQTIKAEQLNLEEAYELGDLHFRNGHYSAARKYFLTVQEKHPGHVDSLLYLGLAELRMDSVEQSKAIERFRTAHALNPDDEMVNRLLSKMSTGEIALTPCRGESLGESTC
jgi:tetratricopeptide (TPR) repeat protein